MTENDKQIKRFEESRDDLQRRFDANFPKASDELAAEHAATMKRIGDAIRKLKPADAPKRKVTE